MNISAPVGALDMLSLPVVSVGIATDNALHMDSAHRVYTPFGRPVIATGTWYVLVPGGTVTVLSSMTTVAVLVRVVCIILSSVNAPTFCTSIVAIIGLPVLMFVSKLIDLTLTCYSTNSTVHTLSAHTLIVPATVTCLDTSKDTSWFGSNVALKVPTMSLSNLTTIVPVPKTGLKFWAITVTYTISPTLAVYLSSRTDLIVIDACTMSTV